MASHFTVFIVQNAYGLYWFLRGLLSREGPARVRTHLDQVYLGRRVELPFPSRGIE